jgi:hypothetical protein
MFFLYYPELIKIARDFGFKEILVEGMQYAKIRNGSGFELYLESTCGAIQGKVLEVSTRKVLREVETNTYDSFRSYLEEMLEEVTVVGVVNGSN